MRELVFLLEEESAKAMLESLLPRFIDERISVRYIVFEGKQDLEKQLMRRMRGYLNPSAKFIILRDQDDHPDCIAIKTKLLELVATAGKSDSSLIRIACRELEAFYLADLEALELASGTSGVAQLQLKAKYRNPDNFGSPSYEVKSLTKGWYQKVHGSREIGKHLSCENDRSASFRNLLAAIKHFESDLLSA
jgi:Domain of unknown function (DUF4276)